MAGLDKLHLKMMKSLQKTKSIFQKINAKKEIKEKETLFSDKSKSGLGELSKKIENSENLFEKISKQIVAQTELFSQRVQRFQEVMKGLVLKTDDIDELGQSPIMGEMTVEDLEQFLTTLYENYEMMQKQYDDTKDENFLDMAMDTQLAISEINEIKGYLIERGRFDKEFDLKGF